MGKLIARVAIGGVFAGHGLQKLLGWFDGPGIEGTTGMMESLGFRPARQHANMLAATETGGGALLALGALTPAAAAGLIGVMVTAIRTVHQKNGLWNANGGMEFNLALIAALVAIVDGGPGRFSFDAKIGLRDTGPLFAVAALGAGVAGSTYIMQQRQLPAGESAAAAAGAEAAEETEQGVAVPA